MFKSTLHSSIPATFNMGLLLDYIKRHKTDEAKMISFLMDKNIRDYRIGADESLNKGHSFCDISFDLVHYLFDSINFHQLFGSSEISFVLNKKIEVYNDLVTHLKLHLLDDAKDAYIKDAREYYHKLRLYMKPLIIRSVDLHKTMDEFGTVDEGVQRFWYIVDHCIFTNKVKHELNQLKTMMANA